MSKEDRLILVGIVGIVAGLGACIFAPFVGCNSSPGSGEKVGQIVKVSQIGLVCKTWEAELVRGGIVGGSGVTSGQSFHFTIERQADVDLAQIAMRSQREVSIQYRTEFFYLKLRSESGGNFLNDIRPAK